MEISQDDRQKNGVGESGFEDDVPVERIHRVLQALRRNRDQEFWLSARATSAGGSDLLRQYWIGKFGLPENASMDDIREHYRQRLVAENGYPENSTLEQVYDCCDKDDRRWWAENFEEEAEEALDSGQPV